MIKLHSTLGIVATCSLAISLAWLVGGTETASATYDGHGHYKSSSHSRSSHHRWEDEDADWHGHNHDYDYGHNENDDEDDSSCCTNCCNCCDCCLPASDDNGGSESACENNDSTDGDTTDSDGDTSAGGNEQTDDEDTAPTPTLELAVDQKVKVGSGQFVDATTQGEAATGSVGDTVTWQVTVTPVDVDQNEERTVRVVWQAPAGMTPDSIVVDKGTIDGPVWTVDIKDLPAIMTVKATLGTPGILQGSAVISEITCTGGVMAGAGADGYCAFTDPILTNNQDPSYVSAAVSATQAPANPGVLGASTSRGGGAVVGSTTTSPAAVQAAPQSAPQVLAAATLAGTGSNNVLAIVFGLLLMAAPLAAVRIKK